MARRMLVAVSDTQVAMCRVSGLCWIGWYDTAMVRSDHSSLAPCTFACRCPASRRFALIGGIRKDMQDSQTDKGQRRRKYKKKGLLGLRSYVAGTIGVATNHFFSSWIT